MTMPERLGKYPITAVAGKGSMGVVYRGHDPDIKRAVAIKTIRKELLDSDGNDESMSARFRREAQAAGALSHPGIVAVYEYGEDGGYAYIAMEYVEGDSLREYMVRGASWDEHDCVSIMSQLLDALQFAHAHAVWHRDIKPANILVMGNGRIKLTDFGIARIEATDFTKTNVIMGTPGYIAPEVYLGGEVDQRMDIFSAGVLFYNLLAGRPPFHGRAEAVMHDICYHDPAPPSSVDSQRRWPQYDAVVARALEKSPDKRYQSAAAFRAAILAEYAQPLNSTLSDTTIIARAQRPAPPELGSLPKTMPVPGPSTPPPTGWSAPILHGVELELARFVGPVARVLVRRAAQQHKNIEALAQALLESIAQPEDREAFTRAVTGSSRAAVRAGMPADAASVPPAGPADARALTAADLEQATRLLTRYLGPVARVVVKRAAAGGANRREFLNQVAQSLDSDAQRENFLRDASVSSA